MSGAWDKLKEYTRARIGLRNSGFALSTRAWLDFQGAHAQARDSVWQDWDHAGLAKTLGSEACVTLASRARTREEFLLQPPLGRRLAAPETLLKVPGLELAVVISDGLSAQAVANEFLPLWRELAPLLDFSFSRLHLVPFARVAIADEIGERLGASASLILLGERPGMSSPASLGAYLTYGPKVGKHDAGRNCVSNIHPGGLNSTMAARKISSLLHDMLRLRLSGVGLKESEVQLLK